ncbi:phosphonate ABC transporter ATP-binding protein [Actinotalea sp. C106]|uniref:phosphonate ABC transporter ATP-binding protein n=1 Tax=Actinotalea sp. C106 TaxID=2908644 RepID=UPI00202949C3|nr:phosphonate ABC transporter ATP-binding protein [Actinotalea sp. C106]
MAAASVEVRGLTKVYADGHRALSGIDLTVEPGQVLALVGSNGAGKSTLLRCLVRLLEPTAGTALIDGADTTTASRRELRAIRTRVGFVFQKPALVGRLSAFTSVVHGAIGRRGSRCAVPALCPEDVREQAMVALDRVGLAHVAGRRVDALSGGQQQRVSIARMLVQDPAIILADEPVAALDPVSAVEVMELLRDVAVERGLTVLAALHHLDYAVTYTERIVGLQGGRVVLDRSTHEFETRELDAVYAGAS